MVELAMAPYDDNNIPLVNASIVDIDAELSDDSQSIPLASVTVLPTASVVPDHHTMSDITSDPLHPMHLQHPCHCPVSSSDDDASSASHHHDHTLSPYPSSQPTGEGEEPNKEIAFGAGVGGAIFGMVLGGPLFSMIFGVSAAYYTKQQGPAGNLARAVGDVTLLARDKWKEHQEQQHRDCHRITCGGRQARAEARKKFLQGVVKVWKAVMEYVEEHKLIERGSEHLKKIIDQVASHLLEQQKQHHEQEHSRHPSQRGPDPATQKI